MKTMPARSSGCSAAATTEMRPPYECATRTAGVGMLAAANSSCRSAASLAAVRGWAGGGPSQSPGRK